MYPILFQYDPFTIRTAGVFLLIGLCLAIWYFVTQLKSKRLDLNIFINNGWWILLGILVIGRLGYILEHSIELNIFNIISFWDGNFSFHVGFLTFMVLLLLSTFKQLPQYWKILDTLIQPFLIVLFFLSIGNYFSGDNYGVPPSADFWPTITYETERVYYNLPIHPVQFYTAGLVALSFFIAYLLNKKKRVDGVRAIIVGLVFFSGEFLLEFIRGDPIKIIFDYRISQIFDIMIIIILLVLLVLRIQNKYLKIKLLHGTN